ncbi:copper-translocating P-type ATPase [Massarina eburnea CBS 473.64]|uniref:Copper-translocating P-type ATPase n=1 Tax=Massarina eburnea CBS 473.64 TaxID=1395130 RepID=A0A6A6RN58_9PLEO|nr:copper-translocating P-type ATPase [Massarina eburnea CBS 473.64]
MAVNAVEPRKDDCCVPLPAQSGTTKSCLSARGPNPDSSINIAQADITPAENSCQKLCCSENEKITNSDNRSGAPTCCAGKSTPCCDDSCIGRLALRDCQSNCQGRGDKEACPEHVEKAQDLYRERLEAIGCICRALVTRGQESCCLPPIKKAKTRVKAPSRSSVESRLAPLAINGASDLMNSESSTSSCAEGCCGDSKSEVTVETMQIPRKSGQDIDLEKGAVGKEHVILSVTGMTCTGCETKLKRTLKSLPYIANLKTSLVLARAEFELEIGLATANEVVKHLERTTEFKCERITNKGTSLDLICTTDPEQFVEGEWPDGVTDITVVDKKTIHVDYDAKFIGSRDLVEKGWSTPMHLAPLRPDPALEASNKHVWNIGWMTLLSTLLTIPVLVMAWAPLPPRKLAYGSASLALATIVQAVIAGPFYPKAIKDLVFARTIDTDLLIVLSTSTAYIFSVVSFGYMAAGKPLSTGEFFETSTLLVTLIMLGHFVSALARQKAAESISIRSLQVSTAILIDQTGDEPEIDTRLLQYGDVFKVSPDCAIPTDGMVLSGASEIDESMITGEAMPVAKTVKSIVRAGTINGSGTLTIRLTRLPGDNTISTIANMVDEAKLSKPKIQDIADRVAGYFVPMIVALTMVTFVIWIVVGVAIKKQTAPSAAVQALTYAITVLIVSCPCALGLAVPMVIVIASGVAAQRGIIFKSANSIEVAYKTTDVVFDKTGTLTRGELSISSEEWLVDNTSEAKSFLLGVVSNIKHPVSVAIAAHLRKSDVLAASVLDPKTLPGKGVEGTFADQTIRAGNSRWLGLEDNPQVRDVLRKGFTAFCFTIDERLAAVYGLEDTVRSEAVSTISALQDSGIAVHILSGDDDGAVRSVAAKVHIPVEKVRSRCSPSEKQAYIQNLLSPVPGHNTKKPIVIFCGDGTNDAVALASATIGIHMSTGTDVAKSAADVVLMRPDLSCILTMINVSRKSVKRIAFNFAWTFVYNLFAVLLAAGAFVRVRIPPAYAGLGELVSVLPVVAIAVALRWSKI